MGGTVADRDYHYIVEAQDLQTYEARKENLDVVRLIYDFSCYLEADEAMVAIDRMSISVLPTGQAPRSWRQDYPVTLVATTPAPVDTYPLRFVSESFTNTGKSVEILVESGTPDFTYVMSFVAVSSDTQRHKQVDTVVIVEELVNPLMVGSGATVTDPGQVIVIGGSTNLPAGFDGLIIFENSGNLSNVIITFPPSPSLGQTIEFIDALGKDGSYPVTFRGYLNVAVDGDGTTSFVSGFNYDCLRWRWTGSPGWHLMATRFNFLA
jgi:hypothetical protein